MDLYAAMMGDPPTEEEKLAALARQLRAQRNLGLMGQVSRDAAMAPVGKELSIGADAQAEDMSRRAEAARYRRYQEEQSRQSLEQRRAEQLAEDERFKKTYGLDAARLGLERARLAQAKELAAERNALQERLAKLKAAEKDKGLRLASTAAQKAQEAERLANKAADLRTRMPVGSVAAGKDMAIDAASKIWPAAGQRVQSMLYGQDIKNWRADSNLLDQDLSNLAAGLAVTGFELENKQKWSPMAPGITQADAEARWKNIEEKFREKAKYGRGENEAYISAYGAKAEEEDPIDAQIRALEEELAGLQQ